jgi:hypothetical protein
VCIGSVALSGLSRLTAPNPDIKSMYSLTGPPCPSCPHTRLLASPARSMYAGPNPSPCSGHRVTCMACVGALRCIRERRKLGQAVRSLGYQGQPHQLLSHVYVRWSGPNPQSPCNDHTTVSSARLSLEWRPEVQAQVHQHRAESKVRAAGAGAHHTIAP